MLIKDGLDKYDEYFEDNDKKNPRIRNRTNMLVAPKKI